MLDRQRGVSYLILVLLALVIAVITTGPAAPAAASEAENLTRPPDVHELVFLSSSHGLSYGPVAERARREGGSPPFSNVFVTPEAYRSFMKSGRWPQGTTFFLEIRRAQDHADIGASGNSQGEVLGLEAERKDSAYPDGFAYFDFGRGGQEPQGKMLPRSAACYACHRAHGAVEWTFTQFYPEQWAVAQRQGTVRKDYHPHITEPK